MNGHPDERGDRARTDLLLGASVPGVLIADAWAYYTSDPVNEAFLEAAVATGMFGPVVTLAPLVAARWIRSTGLRTPGEIRSGVPRRSPSGGALRNLGLALGWMLASAPLGYLQLDVSRYLVGWFFVVTVPIALWWSVVAGLRVRRASSRPGLG